MSFKKNLYEVVRGAIPQPILNLCTIEFNQLKDAMFFLHGKDPIANPLSFNDPQIEKSFSQYAVPCFESLLVYMKPAIEKVVNKTLHPTYSYSRFYYHGAEMTIHKDRPSCEYSATVCIKNDEDWGPWEIWFEKLNGKAKDIDLHPGDMIVYKGDVLNHWRTPYGGKEQIQTFLHYVDANGPYSNFKYDRRPLLGLPADSQQS